jgi:hypothetical protein
MILLGESIFFSRAWQGNVRRPRTPALATGNIRLARYEHRVRDLRDPRRSQPNGQSLGTDALRVLTLRFSGMSLTAVFG